VMPSEMAFPRISGFWSSLPSIFMSCAGKRLNRRLLQPYLGANDRL